MKAVSVTSPGSPFLYRVGYLLAACLIVLPLSDVSLGILPLDFASIRWRVGAIGLVTGAALLPVLGLFLAMAIAHLARHPVRQYLLATIAGLAGVALVVVLGFFVLDTLQLRNDVNPQRLKLYDRATIKGALSQVLLAVTLLWMAAGSLRASLAARRAERERQKTADPVVMRAGTADVKRLSSAPAMAESK